MGDWFERKQQHLATKAQTDETKRQLRQQILASAPEFWKELQEELNEECDKWNAAYPSRLIIIRQVGSVAPDTKHLLIQGPDAELLIEFNWAVPHIAYRIEAPSKTKGKKFDFAVHYGGVRLQDEKGEGYAVKYASAFFLDLVVHG